MSPPAKPQEPLAARYRREGFIHAQQLLDAEAVAEALADAKGVFARLMATVGIPAPVDDEAAFHEAFVIFGRAHPLLFGRAVAATSTLVSIRALGASAPMIGLVKALGLSSPCCPTPPICYFLTEGLAIPGDHHRAPAHQDWRYLQSSIDALTVWVPLVDVDAARGVVELAPRTHRLGLLPTRSQRHDLRIADGLVDDGAYTAPALRRGDALAFSCLTVHRSGVNASGRVRWAVAYRFANLDEPSFAARGMPNPYRFEPSLEVIDAGFPTAEDLLPIFGPPEEG